MSEKNASAAGHWDDEADIVVVGLGAAGAAAAIEAREQGARVLVLERFSGGGATRISGGIYYAGGGTRHQRDAGFEDSADNMYAYLKQEVQDVVSDRTVRRFCDESLDNIAWLESNGVVFGSAYCPFKTAYPTASYNLYYSGNESFAPYSEHARPAPRGHKPLGRGLGGAKIFQPLHDSALTKGARVRKQCRVTGLITDAQGRVIGVEASALPEGSFWQRLHALISALEYGTRYVTLAIPPFRHVTGRLYALAERFAKPLRIRARQGVVLASGGFIYNREMVRQADPRFIVGTPLGCHGDDGSGINMGRAIGGATGNMSKISTWRFINPPRSFPKGMLVGRSGKRLCNEMLYGARTGDYMVRPENNGEAFLIIDKTLWLASHRDCLPDRSTWFQAGPTLLNLYFNWRKASTIEHLAMKVGINAFELRKTLDAYNRIARSGGEGDELGKFPEFFHQLEPPFIAINCSLGSKVFACATLTQGGLLVNEDTGEVVREDGSVIKGLYAVGRTAVGVSSNGYMSGLAIADCVFTGRRASRHAVGAAR